MNTAIRPLTFTEVDGLGFAAANGRIEGAHVPVRFQPQSLGPLLECLQLAAGNRLPDPSAGDWLVLNGARPLIRALVQGREQWLSPDRERMGFIRAVRGEPDGTALFYSFLMSAQRAANRISGLTAKTAGLLVAAMEEMENNIHEHSGRPETGILAYRAAPAVFEFVACDRGMGILASLQRRQMFSKLPDHGTALQTALADGVSRFDDPQRGRGFRQIFLSLANLYGSLRFRSGDHALMIEGSSPGLDKATTQLVQKPEIDGFFLSVRCDAPR